MVRGWMCLGLFVGRRSFDSVQERISFRRIVIIIMTTAKTPAEMQAYRRQHYRYYTDTRGQKEIELTNRLTRALTQLNLLTLTKPLPSSSSKGIRKEDLLYVLLPGAPPFPNEFAFLQLPGQCIFFPMSCFDKDKSDTQLRQMKTEFDQQAKMLHARINEVSSTKPLVFACHSYGCYVFAVYCQMFNADRIIGIIDVGGAPIRFYPAIANQIRNIDSMTVQGIVDNLDQVHNSVLAISRKAGTNTLDNKYAMLGMARSILSGVGFKDMFEYNRKLPKVLKCIIFGRKDVVFPEGYLSEKAIFYTYQTKFQSHYQKKLSETYKKCYGETCQHVQEKFIYSIEDGLHTIHVQRKQKDLMAQIVSRYLSFLQEVHSQSPSL